MNWVDDLAKIVVFAVVIAIIAIVCAAGLMAGDVLFLILHNGG